jgi:caffeoyl-CoA O-methyltransferase
MASKTIGLPDDLQSYVAAHCSPPDEVVLDLIRETQSALPDDAEMQIAPEQGALLTLLARLIGARNAVEVGTFTGLSALAIARGLVEGGRLTCFDISDEYTSVARRYWARAGVADRIDLRIGPAAEGLRRLPAEPTVDLAFIDADKENYPLYWSELVPRMRPGGVLMVDNVLRGGRVLAPESTRDRVVVGFNEAVRADDRVEAVMLGVADGITLARKR